MSELKQYEIPLQKILDFTQIDNELPNFADMQFLPAISDSRLKYRFYRVDEISEGTAAQYRLDMTNVLSSLSGNNNSIIYLLSGKPEGITLYLGVAGTNHPEDEAEILEYAFNGHFSGAKLHNVKNDDPDLSELAHLFSRSKEIGLISGVPSYNEEEANLDGKDFQGIERLANSLIGDTWQMVIVAEPASDAEINQALNHVYDLTTQLSSHIKHSIQQSENSGWSKNSTDGTSESSAKSTNSGESRAETKGTSESHTNGTSNSSSSKSNTKGTNDGITTTKNTGSSDSYTKGISTSSTAGESGGQSLSLTRERIDKRNEQTYTHLNETQIKRFLSGRSKGMFRTAVYVCAPNSNTFNRLSKSVLSHFSRLATLIHTACHPQTEISASTDFE